MKKLSKRTAVVDRLRATYTDASSREKLGTNVVMFGTSRNSCSCSCKPRMFVSGNGGDCSSAAPH